MTVVIDSGERYPWRFAGCAIERRRLDCGDYALLEGDSLGAVVERKTFENLLANFGVMPILHQSLAELAEHRFNALVIEAPYEDFISTGKLHHYSPTFCAAAIAELYTTHPGLRVVFCANRKTANMWTCSFFAAVAALSEAETSTIGQAKVPLVPPRSGVRGQKRRG